MRHDMVRVYIGLGSEDVRIMSQISPGCLIIVDNPNFLANHLSEPNRCRVSNTQIPRRVYLRCRLVRDAGNSTIGLRLSHELAVVGTDDRGVEAALKFLGVLFFTQSRPQGVELGARDDACLRCL